MTLKQRKLAKEYVKNGGNGKEAAIAAGYAPAHAEVSASRALRTVKPELNRLMDRAGLSEKTLLDPIRNGLKARAIFQGVETRAPDHSSRLKSSELAWKLRGHLKNNDAGAGASGDAAPRIIFVINTSAGAHAEAIAVRVNADAAAA